MKRLKEIFSFGALPIFVELRGRESLLAQGYSKICGYSPERISLQNGEFTVSVYGSGLTLRHLSEDTIAVDGRIDGLEFL